MHLPIKVNCNDNIVIVSGDRPVRKKKILFKVLVLSIKLSIIHGRNIIITKRCVKSK